MKFDVCLMNPPYDKSMHLKFLEKMIKCNNIVVNISPIRWLQNPMLSNSNSKKYIDTIANHIENLEVIHQDNAAKMFKARLSTDLGIYTCLSKQGSFDWEKFSKSVDGIYAYDIIKKIEDNMPASFEVVGEWKHIDGWRVRVEHFKALPTFDPRSGRDYEVNWKGAYTFGNPLKYSYVYKDGYQNGKYWTEFGNKNQFSKNIGDPIPFSIKFNSKEEAINFENSLNTIFVQFVKRYFQIDTVVPIKYLPFMNDYSHSWSDQDYKKFFKIDEKEWKTIIAIMKPYLLAI